MPKKTLYYPMTENETLIDINLDNVLDENCTNPKKAIKLGHEWQRNQIMDMDRPDDFIIVKIDVNYTALKPKYRYDK